MNLMQQIYVGLLTSLMVSACIATEHKQYYEILHKSEPIFDIEDYHADIVLGMLPYIKTSIKDFRKRNFTNSDIENMYQTLTIFWPVVRKYLHLKEEFVDNEPSEDNVKYKFNTSSSSSENKKILSKDNLQFKNVQTKNKIGQSQITQSTPIAYERDNPISSKGETPIPDTTVPTPSINRQNIKRRKYVPRFKSIRESLPVSVDSQPEIFANPETSVPTPTKDKQNTNIRNLVKMKGIRESMPKSDDKINVPSHFQSARTTFTKNNSVRRRTFKSLSNKSFLTTTTTERPSGRSFKFISSDSISSAEEAPQTTTSNKPFSYTTRRPYSRTFKRISQDSISPVIERLIQPTGKSSKLSNQDIISTVEEIATAKTVSTPAPYLPTSRRPSRRPSIPLNRKPISTQAESPFANLYHQLLRNSALRLIQAATQTPSTGNISKSARIPDRFKTTNTATRSNTTPKSIPVPKSTPKSIPVPKSTPKSIPVPKPTPKSIPVPDPTTNLSVIKSTRTTIRSKPTRTSISSTSSITPAPTSRIASEIITSSSPRTTGNINSRNSATDENRATDRSPLETLKPPVNENTFYYTDISSIMRALGNPIDLTNLTG